MCTLRLGVLVLTSLSPVLAATAQEQSPPAAERAPTWHFERPHDPWLPTPPTDWRPWTPPPQFGNFTSVQVNVDASGNNIPNDAANEPSIAVDPTDPRRLVIGWRQFDNIASNFRQAGWAYSHDSGRTWTFPGRIEPGVFRSDPVIEADAQGNFYYLSLAGDFLVDMFISRDGGVTWPEKVFAYGGDKQWFVIDKTDSPGRGNIYEAWSTAGNPHQPNQFCRSVDDGASFQQPIRLPAEQVWGTLDVDSDGNLYISGTDFGADFVVTKSTSARFDGQPVTFDFTTHINLGGFIALGGTPNPGGLLGQTWVAADRSNGPTAGNVYLLCSVSPFAGSDPLDVVFTRSTDGGLTWSNPVRVNDDPPGPNAWQWFGTMSVAPNGRIDVIWNDTRDSGQGTISRLYYANSTDGGLTWSENEPLSPPFNSTIGWPNQNKIGDYYDMVSDNVGANVAYAATFNNEQDVYFLRIGDYDCNGNGVGDSEDITLGTSGDFNANGIPDECENLGDMNCDGTLDGADIDPFFLALGFPDDYAQQYPNCDRLKGDINGDGALDGGDIDVFFELLAG